MEYKYIAVATGELNNLFNVRAEDCQGSTVLYDHRKIIEEMESEGYVYSGWIPVSISMDGKIKTIDLIFRKEA